MRVQNRTANKRRKIFAFFFFFHRATRLTIYPVQDYKKGPGYDKEGRDRPGYSWADSHSINPAREENAACKKNMGKTKRAALGRNQSKYPFTQD